MTVNIFFKIRVQMYEQHCLTIITLVSTKIIIVSTNEDISRSNSSSSKLHTHTYTYNLHIYILDR